jgi:hypothetical protein
MRIAALLLVVCATAAPLDAGTRVPAYEAQAAPQKPQA